MIETAKSGYTDGVKLLLQQGAEIEAHNLGRRYTALIAAARHRHLSTVKLLIKHGANINAAHEYMNTALTWVFKGAP